MIISLMWTLSRSGIVGFLAAAGCFSWLIIRRSQLAPLRRVAIVAVFGVVAVALVNIRGVGVILNWFTDTTDAVGRLAAWGDGWRVVRDFPVAGTGINTYRYVMLLYQKNVSDVWMTHAHNDYLQLLAEGGLLVSIPVGAAVVLLMVAIRRRLNSVRLESYEYWVRAGAAVGLLAVGVQELVEFSLHIPANALLFATLAAVACSPAAHRRQQSRLDAPSWIETPAPSTPTLRKIV
jgi:O-antigen ligase